MNIQREKILGNVGADEFIGRVAELEEVVRHSRGEGRAKGMLVSGAPLSGVSELLRQAYDSLFADNDEAIPFYFAFRRSDKTIKQAVTRFLLTFLQQTVAFRRRDSRIIDSSADVCEIAELALPSDGFWIDRLIDTCQRESRLNNDDNFGRTCLSAPLRAWSHGVKVVVILDDLHETEYLAGDLDLLAELTAIYSRADGPFIFGGRRRFLFGRNADEFQTLSLRSLNFTQTTQLIERFAASYGVAVNDQTRDLIAVQLDANPLFIRSVFQSANERAIALDSFQRFEQLYTDELFGGRLGRYFDGIFGAVANGVETEKQILGLLFDALGDAEHKSHVETWQSRAELGGDDFARLMRRLNIDEIIRLSSNLVEPMRENRVLADYVAARFRLEIILQNRALTVGESMTEYLKRAPRLMGEFYRRNASIGLREVLSVFNRQEVPVSLLDYAAFRDELKGAPDDEAFRELAAEGADKITLPQVIYTAHTVSFYPQFAQLAERERSAVALGFLESNYTDGDETVWIAAEIDSKLEAKRELTEFWCDRLEMVALMCNFVNYRLWLVAPEGFAPDALEVLQNRGAFGSSRKQVSLLVRYLGAADAIASRENADEYEMVVPMGDDTELIAAQTVEEIARRHNFPAKAINQIKTALVEACINAAEHSLSPDRRIYQKFSVADDKLTITVSNRGLRLVDKTAHEVQPDEGRRGWGLKLMRSLMDEVRFETTDDGTRISMVKAVGKP